MKKKLLCAILILFIILPQVSMRSEAASGKWKKDSKGYYYVYSNGSHSKKGWKTIGGKKYYFNAKGYRVTGWKKIGGKKYHFTAKGVMQTGWRKLSGKKYYFGKNGVLNTKKKLKIKGKVYLFNKDGSLHTHNYKYVSRRLATCTKDGKKTYKCSCGDSYTETIKATGHKFSKEWIESTDIIQKQVYERVKLYIGDNGYNFNDHGYTTVDQVWDKIEYDIINDVPESEGGCGCYGFHTAWKTVIITPGIENNNYYHGCTKCRYREYTRTETVIYDDCIRIY